MELPDPSIAVNTLVVRRRGSLYRIEEDAGCAVPSRAVGQTVLILSPGPFAGPGSEILEAGTGANCPIRQGDAQ